jgi:hypothetical protein
LVDALAELHGKRSVAVRQQLYCGIGHALRKACGSRGAA